MPPRLSSEELAIALGTRLGGTVRDLRRLSGGASRMTSAFDLETKAGLAPLVLQMDRSGGEPGRAKARLEYALLEASRAAGVPVPTVVASGVDGDELGGAWLVVQRIEGETIPRKILRDPEWAHARDVLTAQCGRALAAIHTIDPEAIDGLPPADPLRNPLALLDSLHEVRPALELGVRWLATHRPEPEQDSAVTVTVHGDFRCGNLLVGPEGLRGVLDWELAHAGDPAEDIGWLCAPAWRFGGPGEVGGFGSVAELLEAYEDAGGAPVSPERVHWWQVYATVKWAAICALQASSHLSGLTRSMELAATGRRVCESEWNLFMLLGVTPPATQPEPVEAAGPLPPFGRPTAAELAEAVREYLDGVMEKSEGAAGFDARVARNALGVIERELRLGPSLAAAHATRLAELGYADDAALAAALRSGALDDDWQRAATALAAAARDQLLVANPSYLPPATA